MNQRAIEAAKRLGMDDRTVLALAKALAPMTPQERERNRAFWTAHAVAEAKLTALKLEWKKMSFAEYAERKANGTLPEMY